MCKARITAADITKLCDEWCSAAAGAGGGTVVGASTRKFELLENGVVFPDLDHDALCAAVVCLSKVLHRPGHGTVRNPDHFWLWSWCGELLLRSSAQQQLFTVDQVDHLRIKILCQTCVYAALVDWGDAQGVTTALLLNVPEAHYGLGFLQRSHAALAYLVFPLLDAVLKRACPSYVAMDGTVVQAFTGAPEGMAKAVWGFLSAALTEAMVVFEDATQTEQVLRVGA